MVNIPAKTLYRWYKEVISDYHKDKAEGRFMKERVEVVNRDTGEVKEKSIPICSPHHVGELMSIDEKMIGRKYSVIMSNKDTGKIALLVDSIDPEVVKEGIKRLGSEALSRIKWISMDMSPMMNKISKEVLPQAEIVIDKFHVMKHVYDAVQGIRLDIKKGIKEGREQSGKKERGEMKYSGIELLEKGRYLLFKKREELKEEERSLLEMLLGRFKHLWVGYELLEQFREWYDKKHIGMSMQKIKERLYAWKEGVRKSGLKQYRSILRMLDRYEEEIVRYFIGGQTSSRAENINGIIERMVMSQYGIRNREFFFYRMQVYFSPTPEKKN